MANNVPFSSLDFDNIKADLKTYLSSQQQFRDYDFEGSNMNVLLDVLSYNTFKNNHYNNMAISEMFLDSAKTENSVASHAKELGYLPRSRAASRAVVDVTLTVTGTQPAFITIPARTKFTARCANKTFTFANQESATITPVDGVYTAFDLDIHEGEWKTELFTVIEDSRFIISDPFADIGSVEVRVRENTDPNAPILDFQRATSLFGVNKDDKVFYIQAAFDNKYEIVFGLDNFGVQPIVGNVIEVSYRRTEGDTANGIEVFTPASTIAGYAAISNTVSNATGGAERENIESIKYFAPKSVQIQDRAITESDYEILLKNKYPEISAVSVYGGERAVPPQYGRVIVAVDVANVDGVTNVARVRYQTYLSERAALAIEPIVVSPEFMFVEVVTIVTFDTNKTSKSTADIRQLVGAAITNYNDTSLGDFDKNVRFSKLSEAIDDADPYIVGNDTEIRAIVEVVPVPNVAQTINVNFRNVLRKNVQFTKDTVLADYVPAIVSSPFGYGDVLGFLQDDGNGVLNILSKTEDGFVFLTKNVGAVDYETGEISVMKLSVTSLIGGAIKIYANTKSHDIIGPKERMLSINSNDVNIQVRTVQDDG